MCLCAITATLLICLPLSYSSANLTDFHPFLYKNVLFERIESAYVYGQTQRENYLVESENATIEERQLIYDEYISKCNILGNAETDLIIDETEKKKNVSNSKLLLTIGLQPFVAKFITRPRLEILENINRLCTKFERQLHCQLGFGDSRSQILTRLNTLKRTNGDLKLLIERECNKGSSAIVYHCLGTDVKTWTTPCHEEMLVYNYTRYSAGRRVARLHFKGTKEVAELLDQHKIKKGKHYVLSKDYVKAIYQRTLRKIADIEGEKCLALDEVLKCIIPIARKRCERGTRDLLETSVLVGYLARERPDILHQHFIDFNVPPSPLCTKLNPLI